MAITNGQQYETNQVHYLRKRITFADAGTTVSLGWLPFGAVVINTVTTVVTAFNGDSTNTVDIGYRNGGNSETDDTDEFADGVALGTAGRILSTTINTAANTYFPRGCEVVAPVVSTADPGAGVAYLAVEYTVDNDGDTST